MLHARSRNADGIAFLERILADCGRRHLPGDDNQWNGVHVGSRYARDRIGHARPGRHQGHPDLVRRPGVAIGRMRGPLFVPYQNVLDLVLLE